MAGPVASVLLRSKLTPERVARLRSDIAAMASTVQGNDFWLEERPFILSIGPEHAEEIPELCEHGLPQLSGWVPADIVRFSAMCNDVRDHQLLAGLCSELAEQEGGLVDFGGHLAMAPTPKAGCERVDVPHTSGILFATSSSHYGDATFVRAWLRHPRFHMVK